MKGIFGKYLDVNLEKGFIGEYEIPAEWYEKFVGGRGLGVRILLEELDGNEDPLGPENILIVATGPFQGLDIAGSSRVGVLALSPKTGAISDSYVGGNLGGELGKAGYDGIILRSHSKKPVYLVILDGKTKILNASHLWGKDTGLVDRELRKIHGNGISALCIGPAGENLVPFSSIICDNHHAAGRPGFGAVMGAKNLKAIVVRGHTQKDLFDTDGFKKARQEFSASLLKNKYTMDMGKYGTALDVGSLNEAGMLPTKNFQKGTFDEADKLTGETMYETILVGRSACHPCVIRCKREVETEFNGQKVTRDYGGPEYETIAAFGSNLLISDLDFVAMANMKCNALGLDTISTGVTLAYAMEASEKGMLDLDIHWGSTNGLIELIEAIAYKREGIGNYLAKGIATLENQLHTDFAMQIKGQEIPLHEPRGKKGLAISYSTSPRGATHLEGFHDPMVASANASPEMGITQSMDPRSLRDKPAVVRTFEDQMSFINSAILCVIVCYRFGPHYNMNIVRDMLHKATGLSTDLHDMLAIGERGYNLLKVGAAFAGYQRTADDLPSRFKTESFSEGPTAGEIIADGVLKSAIDEYYRIRGFDAFGPTDETLDKLGLEDLKHRMRAVREKQEEQL